jgi:hypothetical protein
MEAADSLMAAPGQTILELLSGQGLTVKRQPARHLAADA